MMSVPAKVMEIRTLPKREVSIKLGLAEPKDPSHVSMTCLRTCCTLTPAALAAIWDNDDGNTLESHAMLFHISGTAKI